MRHLILIVVFLLPKTLLFAQSSMEKDCAIRIVEQSKNKTFSKYTGTVTCQRDTFRFADDTLIVSDTETELLELFKKGILFPNLILGANTRSDGKFFTVPDSLAFSLKISSVRELNFNENICTHKKFSLLLWRYNVANPSLYIFELSNENATPKISMKLFIKNSKLTAFGFCSILI